VASDVALKMPLGVLPCRGVHVPLACADTYSYFDRDVSAASWLLAGITLQAEMLPHPQTRPPLALSVASAAPPRSLLCVHIQEEE
jgi:hypothetical protein